MKRTDPEVRKRCREIHGNEWFKVNKKERQDAAIQYLTEHSKAQEDSDDSEIRTVVQKALSGHTISSVQKVYNTPMRACYDMLKRVLNGDAEYKYLFHGTTAETAQKIIANGFNRSYCGRNGTVFGKGVYFARDISYSLQPTYSPAAADGKKVVIVARVLVGNMMVGNGAIVEPAPGYDSTVNCLNDPTIFVVYKDYQALPEYLLTFTTK